MLSTGSCTYSAESSLRPSILARRIQNAHRQIAVAALMQRAQPRRFHFHGNPLAFLHLDAVHIDVRVGSRQNLPLDGRIQRHGLGLLDGVVLADLVLELVDRRERAHPERHRIAQRRRRAHAQHMLAQRTILRDLKLDLEAVADKAANPAALIPGREKTISFGFSRNDPWNSTSTVDPDARPRAAAGSPPCTAARRAGSPRAIVRRRTQWAGIFAPSRSAT